MSLSQTESFLESHGISTTDAPPIWQEEFIYCVIGQYGKVRSHEADGIRYKERVFLRKAWRALGLKYEGLGIILKGGYSDKDEHLVALHVPKDWTFNPDRQVAPVKVCVKCNDLVEKFARESARVGVCCQCYSILSLNEMLWYDTNDWRRVEITLS